MQCRQRGDGGASLAIIEIRISGLTPGDNEMETVAPVRIYNESDQHSYKLISSQ